MKLESFELNLRGVRKLSYYVTWIGGIAFDIVRPDEYPALTGHEAMRMFRLHDSDKMGD